MTYIDLYENAVYDLKNKTITIEEYDEIIKPLRKEVDSDIKELEKIKDRLEVAMWYNRRDKEYCLELIGKRISELKGE